MSWTLEALLKTLEDAEYLLAELREKSQNEELRLLRRIEQLIIQKRTAIEALETCHRVDHTDECAVRMAQDPTEPCDCGLNEHNVWLDGVLEKVKM